MIELADIILAKKIECKMSSMGTTGFGNMRCNIHLLNDEVENVKGIRFIQTFGNIDTVASSLNELEFTPTDKQATTIQIDKRTDSLYIKGVM